MTATTVHAVTCFGDPDCRARKITPRGVLPARWAAEGGHAYCPRCAIARGFDIPPVKKQSGTPRPSLLDAIVRHLEIVGECSIGEIVAGVDRTQKSVAWALARGIKRGRVRRVKHGRYALETVDESGEA